MSHKLRRGLIVLAAALMLLGAVRHDGVRRSGRRARLATATESATSNPAPVPDHWWRQGWGRTLYPDLALNPPEGMDWKIDGYIIGMLYSVDRHARAWTPTRAAATPSSTRPLPRTTTAPRSAARRTTPVRTAPTPRTRSTCSASTPTRRLVVGRLRSGAANPSKASGSCTTATSRTSRYSLRTFTPSASVSTPRRRIL